jgi:hypothetical protein
MLIIIMRSVFALNVTMFGIIFKRVITLIGITLSGIMLSVIMLDVFILGDIMQS